MIKFWKDRVNKEKSVFTFSEGATHLLSSTRLGFTLAETLITLGIIGVVAAMTIPTLISNHQKKQTVVKLQKAISVMNQAYRLAYDDVGETTPEEARALGAQGYFDKFWAPYIKVQSICQLNVGGCEYGESFPWKTPNGNVYNLGVGTYDSRVAFTSMDGFFYIVVTFTGTASLGRDITSSTIYVDINGTAKPNTLGKDVFILDRKNDGEKGGVVVPLCSTKSDADINASCSLTGAGECCAEKIKRSGWNIDKSYPWK